MATNAKMHYKVKELMSKSALPRDAQVMYLQQAQCQGPQQFGQVGKPMRHRWLHRHVPNFVISGEPPKTRLQSPTPFGLSAEISGRRFLSKYVPRSQQHQVKQP